MADRDFEVKGVPDGSGDAFPEPLEEAMTLGTAALGTTQGYTVLAPTGTDIGLHGSFDIPRGYNGSPRMRISCLVAQAASILALGLQQFKVPDAGPVDVAYETEDLANNSDWTGYAAEDKIELTITITPSVAYVEGDTVYWFLFRDNSVDTQTGEIHDVKTFFLFDAVL